MTWFNSNILRNDSTTCSDSLLLYTGGSNTAYRNEYIQRPTVPFGFSTSRISVFAEVPDVVVPVGQASYQSTITNHTEVLPVTVDLMAAKGCDGMVSTDRSVTLHLSSRPILSDLPVCFLFASCSQLP